MEGCRTGGRIWHGIQMGMVGGGKEGGWCCRLLGGVEKMGRVLPHSCICHMNMGCKAGPAQGQMFAWIKHSERVPDLSLQPAMAWPSHIPDWFNTTIALSLLPQPPSIPCSCRVLLKANRIFLPHLCVYGSDLQCQIPPYRLFHHHHHPFFILPLAECSI